MLLMKVFERGTRSGSQNTRRAILLAATPLFAERGFADVSLNEVAASADVFPNQITYYFGSKDGLFVEVAGRLVLEAGRTAEPEAQDAMTVHAYNRALAQAVLGAGLHAVLAFIEAMLIARRRPDLTENIKGTLDRLHEQGARASAEIIARKGWSMRTSPEVASRNFWATITGVALQMVASGDTTVTGQVDALALIELNLNDKKISKSN